MANCEARDLGDVRATLEKTSDVEYIYKKSGKLLECVCLVRKSGMSVNSAKSDARA